MTSTRLLLIFSRAAAAQALQEQILAPAGFEALFAAEERTARSLLSQQKADIAIIGERLGVQSGLEIGESLLQDFPLLPIILLAEKPSRTLALEAWRRGFCDVLEPPLRPEQILQAVQRAQSRTARLRNYLDKQIQSSLQPLDLQLKSLQTIQQIGRQVTSLLNPDSVLEAVVDAAVDLTGAEEGSLLLLDESSGELYMRASRNFQEDFVRTFRLPIQDSLAGQVIRTGKPLLVEDKAPRKIKTAYLVHTILYAPLVIKDRVIGVLEVDNRKSRSAITEQQAQLVSALAEYAAIAIENAHAYNLSELERTKLETILTSLEEGVIVLDQDRRIILINPRARQAFGITEENIGGRRLRDVIRHQELLETLQSEPHTSPSRLELTLEDGRVLNTQISPIPNLGLVLTMQDITHLKELDRIKSEFVSTVSHDLRSPLTAILGYVELLERVGPLNDQQRDFVSRVELSVHNITTLINDLLELGRIEAGFDTRKELIPFHNLIELTIEELKSQIEEKKQVFIKDSPDELPSVLGNPVQLRQMLNNLLSNAIKYTPVGGRITLHARPEGEQIIVQVSDTGPGIPPADQPYIFDKFYRASNISSDIPGTGLGLAIVKSVVENHLGRVWVDSVLGQGTTFTIVLPISREEI